jgi:hypothetical protein
MDQSELKFKCKFNENHDNKFEIEKHLLTRFTMFRCFGKLF